MKERHWQEQERGCDGWGRKALWGQLLDSLGMAWYEKTGLIEHMKMAFQSDALKNSRQGTKTLALIVSVCSRMWITNHVWHTGKQSVWRGLEVEHIDQNAFSEANGSFLTFASHSYADEGNVCIKLLIGLQRLPDIHYLFCWYLLPTPEAPETIVKIILYSEVYSAPCM